MKIRTRITTRSKLIERTSELLRDIEIQFNTAAHWNESVRKPAEERIEIDGDGQLQKIAAALAETLRNESPHKIPRSEWIAQIRKLAIDKYEFTEAGAAKTDWAEYAHQFYLECMPEEALIEDLSNA